MLRRGLYTLAGISWRCVWAAETLWCPWFALRHQSQTAAGTQTYLRQVVLVRSAVEHCIMHSHLFAEGGCIRQVEVLAKHILSVCVLLP